MRAVSPKKFSKQTHSNIHLFIFRERSNTRPVLDALEAVWVAVPETGHDATNASPTQSVVCFLVGPEGGWSVVEKQCLDALEQAHPQCVHNTSLGPTIFRTETAAMTAIAVCTLHWDTSRHCRR